MAGIESLKAAVSVAISFPFQAAKTIKNKFKIWDLLAFADEFKELATVIADRQNIADEFKDLDDAERDELLQYAKDEFDIPDDSVEVFVENALTWVDSTLTLINEAKKLKKK